MTDLSASLKAGAAEILLTAEPLGKAAKMRRLVEAWRGGSLPRGSTPTNLPERPARPPRPELRLPRDMPKRRAGGATRSRIALLHALAHIELNALDLVCDLLARFDFDAPDYYDDWIRVGAEEAVHYELLDTRLTALGATYGDLPAHDGLWQAATVTAENLLARLAIVPLVLEARGLDVTPRMIETMTSIGDDESAAILDIIYREEIGHVAIGRHWFEAMCTADGMDPVATWQTLVREYFRGALKPPFNLPAREAAGFGAEYYSAMADAQPGRPPHAQATYREGSFSR